MLTRLVVATLAVAFSSAQAHAQLATYEKGSIYDIDPSARQATGDRILEQVLNSNDMQPVRDLARGDILRKLSKPVGRLAIGLAGGKVAFCTASVISQDLILTNHHCIPGRGNVREALLWMGYLVPKSRRGVAQYPVEIEPVETNEELDYSILRVRGQPGKEWGTIEFGLGEPVPRTSLFIVHHPGGFAKHITLGRCQTADPAIDDNDLLHVCDTLGGSSGAPIFDNNTRKVVGLHYGAVGLRALNAGKRIASIAATSPIVAGLVPDPVKEEKKKRSQEARTIWQDVSSSESTAVLAAFAEQFPDSVYAKLAAARINELLENERRRAEAEAEKERRRLADEERANERERRAREQKLVEEAEKKKRLASFEAQSSETSVSETSIMDGTTKEQPRALSEREMITQVQTELKRLGCYRFRIDGDWGPGSRSAMREFNSATSRNLETEKISLKELQALSAVKRPVCESSRPDQARQRSNARERAARARDEAGPTRPRSVARKPKRTSKPLPYCNELGYAPFGQLRAKAAGKCR